MWKEKQLFDDLFVAGKYAWHFEVWHKQRFDKSYKAFARLNELLTNVFCRTYAWSAHHLAVLAALLCAKVQGVW
jgi:hypothetical protein